jgi:anaerobic selenocysteine-containing dehydrogenase
LRDRERRPRSSLTLAGFACAKVKRDAELVHSPERLSTPYAGLGRRARAISRPIGCDPALDEIVARWLAIHRRIRASGITSTLSPQLRFRAARGDVRADGPAH